MKMTSDKLLLDITSSGIATLKLNDDKTLNELTTEMLSNISISLKNLEKNKQVKVVIITGGVKSFSCGSNILEMHNRSAIEVFNDERASYWKEIFSFKKPMIASVSRMALGSGFELALACDYIVSSKTAVLGSPEIGLGIIPGAGAAAVLKKVVGKFKAFEILTSGKHYSGAELQSLGLVSKVVEESELLIESVKIAEQLASLPLNSIILLKECLRDSATAEQYNYERALFSIASATSDAHEGMTAYLEKRNPKY